MSGQKKRKLITISSVLLVVVFAYAFRLIGKGSFYPTLFSYLRSFLYIGLYAAWGLSIRFRIVQKQVGGYLIGVSVLLILWFSFRTTKYFIFWQPDANQTDHYGRNSLMQAVSEATLICPVKNTETGGYYPGRVITSEMAEDLRRVFRLLIEHGADKNNISAYSKKSIREHYENESVWQICGVFWNE